MTGSSVQVTCLEGYSGGGTATCQSSGSFSSVSCTAAACSPTQVPNSNTASTGSITGVTGSSVQVTCLDGYSGGGTVTCQSSGSFFCFM